MSLTTLEKMQKEYDEPVYETEEIRQNSVGEIKKWLDENQNLHARTEYKYILPFLRNCKYNIEKTKKKIISHYTMKKNHPQWYTKRDPEDEVVKEITKLGVCIPIKCSDNKLPLIIRFKYDPSKYDISDAMKVMLMIFDIAAMENENAQKHGVISIVDFEDISFGHCKRFTYSLIKSASQISLNLTCRMKRMEFINTPYFMSIFINIFRTLLPQKLRTRIRVSYKGRETLEEFISKDVLPKEYGGEAGTFEEMGEFWLDKLEEYKAWFKEDEKHRAE